MSGEREQQISKAFDAWWDSLSQMERQGMDSEAEIGFRAGYGQLLDALAAKQQEMERLQQANENNLAGWMNDRAGWSAKQIRLESEVEHLREALKFYADPETYFAVAFLPDPPCGDFIDDFEELSGDLGHPDGYSWTKPGKRARAALARKSFHD